LRVDPTGTTAQPVTDNAGSLTVDNAGTFAVQDSEKVADNAGFTDGTTKVLPAGFIFDETAGTALTENDAAAARIDSKRAQVLVLEDATTRGQRATVTASNALKVDGSAVTQPISGTLTAVTSITNVVHVDDNSGSLTVDVADTTATGNLTGTAQAATVSSLNGANAASVQITGVFVATVQFEGTVDGSNWFSVNAIVITTGALVTSATATGQWQVDVAGFSGFRVRCSAFTSGTVVVTIRSSLTGCGGFALDTPLPAGTNIIGALSANQSTNVAQLAGTTTDTNSGNKSAGTLRVVLATDQPQLTNKLLVTPDANSAVNVAQINGVATTMGNGVSGTGVQRVTIASDSTGQIIALGNVASGASDSGNPIKAGAHAKSSDITAVTTDQRVDLIASLLGKLLVLPYALPGATWSFAAASGGLVTTTGVTAKAAAGAGIRNYVTGATVQNSNGSTSTDVQIRDGASGTVLARLWAQSGGGGASVKFDPPLRGTANTLVEIAEGTATATNGVFVNLQGYTAAE
jgi:hypothetical protein